MRIDDESLIAAAKEVLGDHYLDSDEEFLNWANENYYAEAGSWVEFARDCVESGTWGEVPPGLECYLNYEVIGNDLSHDFYMAGGIVFTAD